MFALVKNVWRKRPPLIRVLRSGRWFIILGMGLIAFLFTQTEQFQTDVNIQRWTGQCHDAHFRLRPYRPKNPNIAMVSIGGSSFELSGYDDVVDQSEALQLMRDNTWPWPRTIFALAIERLFEMGAKVVAIDVVFHYEREDDDALARVLEKYKGRVIIASIVQTKEGDVVGGALQNSTQFFYPNDKLMEAAGPENVGLARQLGDPDKVIRRFDYRTSELRESGLDDDSQDMVTFAPLAVERYTGVPSDKGYSQIINYYGPLYTYPVIPFEFLFLGGKWQKDSRLENGNVFRDKIVMIGPYAEILHDVHPVPVGHSLMPGAEVHAHIAGSILEKNFIKEASSGFNRFIAVLCIIACALVVLMIPNAVGQTFGVLGVIFAYALGSQLAFTKGNLLLYDVPPLAGSIVTSAFGITYLFFLAQWEKAHTRNVLNRFVSKKVAAVVLKNAEEFNKARRGEKRPVAIFFSDIRGFTTWTEKAEAENLVGQLTEYFERMVSIIEPVGTVQKFIGDAILAAWGDVHSDGQKIDACHAVEAVLKIRPALRELNKSWEGREDREVISIGMGVNHGEVIVGEAGAFERTEFTVLGDGVNFAARLESATKQFHTDCLVGQSVEELTRDKFIFRRVDYLKVKGKKKPVHVFTPLSDIATAPPEWLPDYHRAIEELYWKQKFPEAITLFNDVKSRIGTEDFLCDLYIGLCEKMITAPPAADWDGSRELTDK